MKKENSLNTNAASISTLFLLGVKPPPPLRTNYEMLLSLYRRLVMGFENYLQSNIKSKFGKEKKKRKKYVCKQTIEALDNSMLIILYYI